MTIHQTILQVVVGPTVRPLMARMNGIVELKFKMTRDYWNLQGARINTNYRLSILNIAY